MADFEQVLSKAIDGLPNNTSELRRALYDRARTSLIAQLKGMTPALPQTEIAKQRLALEHAIRKVETQCALGNRVKETINNTPPPIVKTEISEAKHNNTQSEEPSIEVHVALPIAASQPAESTEPESSEPELREPENNTRSYEYKIDNQEQVQSVASPVLHAKMNKKSIEGVQTPIRIVNVSEETLVNEIPEEYSRLSELPAPHSTSKLLKAINLFKRPNFKTEVESNISSQHHNIVKAPKFGRVEFVAFERKNILRMGGVVLACCALGILFLSSGMISKLISSVPKDVIGAKSNEVKTNKFTDRLMPEIETSVADNKSEAQNETIINIAQTAILYEENPNIPQKGEAFKGQILWTTEQETVSDGKIEKFLRGVIEIPARKMKIILTLRRNFDSTIPATHTAELLFELAPDFIQKGISSVPGILVKPAEQAKGVPLIGASARITNNYFLIALSNQAGDKDRNIANLKEKSWLEIPILYESRLRAVLVMNKGTSGEKMFQQVFDSWK